MFNSEAGSARCLQPGVGTLPATCLASVKAAAVAAAAAVAGAGPGPQFSLGAPPCRRRRLLAERLARRTRRITSGRKPRTTTTRRRRRRPSWPPPASGRRRRQPSVAAASVAPGRPGAAPGRLRTGAGAGRRQRAAQLSGHPGAQQGLAGGVLQKFPGCGASPHPYTFPAAAAAFGLCHAEDAAPRPRPWGAGGAAVAPKAVVGLFCWPAAARTPSTRPSACSGLHGPRAGFRCPRGLRSPRRSPRRHWLRAGGKPGPCCARPSWTWPSPAARAGVGASGAPPGQPSVVAAARAPASRPPAGGVARDASRPPRAAAAGTAVGSTPPSRPGSVTGRRSGLRAPEGPRPPPSPPGGAQKPAEAATTRAPSGRWAARMTRRAWPSCTGRPRACRTRPQRIITTHHHHPRTSTTTTTTTTTPLPPPSPPLLLLPPQPDEPGSERHQCGPAAAAPATPPLAPQPHPRGPCPRWYPAAATPARTAPRTRTTEKSGAGGRRRASAPEGEEEEDEASIFEDDEEEDDETGVLPADPGRRRPVPPGRQRRGLSEKLSSRTARRSPRGARWRRASRGCCRRTGNW